MKKTGTMDERAEEYYNGFSNKTQSYKGDIVTSYVIGCMDQQRIERALLINDTTETPIERLRNVLSPFINLVQMMHDNADKSFLEKQLKSCDIEAVNRWLDVGAIEFAKNNLVDEEFQKEEWRKLVKTIKRDVKAGFKTKAIARALSEFLILKEVKK